ncbi:uncharacterized protein LOC127715284 isoform X2 [Mytilus californianus]|uniref:uncharacterized protein LOC127715284 isoform X2 n=1 Tax=Mytilus californianus TaxID=6549 RepID=UPI002246ECE4|nr:uncharacterized protein LOC127715284 isoform X2 [Mytilus californianus]
MWHIAANEIYILILGILFTVFIGFISIKLFQVRFPQLTCGPAKETFIVFVAIMLTLLLLPTICVVEDIVGTWLHVFLHHLCTSFVILLVILGICFRKEIANGLTENIFSTEKQSSPSPKFSVTRKSQYGRQMSRRGSKQHNTNKSLSPKRERRVYINYEMELKKGYIQAICSVHKDMKEETIKKAMRYMNDRGIFTAERRKAEVVLKNIEHIKNLEGWAINFGMERVPGMEFPKELTKKQMEDVLLKMNLWKPLDIKVVLQQNFSKYGFYPIPTEFHSIYEEKKAELMKTRKRHRKESSILRSKNNDLQQENVAIKQNTISKATHQQLLGELQAKLDYFQQRLNCKICFEKELEVKVLPCQHVFSCRECFKRTTKTSCFICEGLIQNTEVFCFS